MRTFETDASVGMADALQMIRSALADEGLALGPRSGSHDDVTSILDDGRKTFRVPDTRVVSLEVDRVMRAALVVIPGGLDVH